MGLSGQESSFIGEACERGCGLLCAGKNRVPIYGGFPQNNELYELFSTDPNEVEQANIKKHFDNNNGDNGDDSEIEHSGKIAKVVESGKFEGFEDDGVDKEPKKLVLPEVEPAVFNEDFSSADDDAFFKKELVDEDPFSVKDDDYGHERFDSGVKTVGNHVARPTNLPDVN